MQMLMRYRSYTSTYICMSPNEQSNIICGVIEQKSVTTALVYEGILEQKPPPKIYRQCSPNKLEHTPTYCLIRKYI